MKHKKVPLITFFVLLAEQLIPVGKENFGGLWSLPEFVANVGDHLPHQDKTHSPSITFKSGEKINFTLNVKSERKDKRISNHSTQITIHAVENVTVPEVPIMCFCNCPGSYGLPSPYEYSCFRADVKKSNKSEDKKIYRWKLLAKGKPFDLSTVKIMSSRENDLIINTMALVAATNSYNFEIIAEDSVKPEHGAITKFEFSVEKFPGGNVEIFRAGNNDYHIIVKIAPFGDLNFPTIYEYYFVSDRENKPDIFFFYCNWPRILNIIPISRMIKVRYCNMRGGCGMIQSHQFNYDSFTPIRLKEILVRTNYFINKKCHGYLSDAFIHIIVTCENILEFKRAENVINEMLSFIVKVELHFFRDICQVLSIYVHCTIKKYDIYKHPTSEKTHFDIISLTDITDYLVFVVEKLETDIKTAYPAQPDHSVDDYRNFILKPFFIIIDIIIENKYIILRKPSTKKDHKGIEQLYYISKNLLTIFEKLNKIFGRKLVPGSMKPVTENTKYVFFHAQKDLPNFLANSIIPDYTYFPREFQTTHNDVRMILPKTLNETISESKNHVLSVNNLTSYQDLIQNFHLRFYLGAPKSSVQYSAVAPPSEASLKEMDDSINVYIFDCKESIFEVRVLEIAHYEYLKVIFLKDIFPDYGMNATFTKIDSKTSFVVNISDIENKPLDDEEREGSLHYCRDLHLKTSK
ncbi:uncharacterized protein LOC142327952 [Lycorma delicatula]|uniref:uncharacterized protein LOC142327952 n=1 Tax=Lycorma delicatula TaxID=130591 RepID=UPI003F5134AE